MAQSKKNSSKSGAGKGGRKTNSRPAAKASIPEEEEKLYKRIAAVVFVFLAIFVVISFFNDEGAFIVFFTDLIKGLVGWGYWICAPVFVFVAIILYFAGDRPDRGRVFSALMLPVLFSSMANLLFYRVPAGSFDLKLSASRLFEQGKMLESGGAIGGLISIGLKNALSIYGALPLLLLLFVLFAVIAFNGSVTSFVENIAARRQNEEEEFIDPRLLLAAERKREGSAAVAAMPRGKRGMDIPLGDDTDAIFPLDKARPASSPSGKPEQKKGKRGKDEEDEVFLDPVFPSKSRFTPARGESKPAPAKAAPPELPADRVNLSTEISDPPKKRVKPAPAQPAAPSSAVPEPVQTNDYSYPSVSLLTSNPSPVSATAREEVLQNRDRLETALRSFGINANVVGLTIGPNVTRYDFELEQGVKLNKITALSGDLALALGVVSVRIAPIPDKISTVGIEVPNKIISTVYLKDILSSANFINARSKLSFALGKDITGESVVGNISKLPHLLIAGTTGSGKSVCMNCLILSLLYKASPAEVKLIMIDPKMVELGIYNGIPHLYVPVVTDPKKAAGALQWSVVEMMKRYNKFSEIGVRDLESYNKHCTAKGEAIMPQVVIVIDELADLMMVASKEVEESVCRVAQMGRAAGMHLVIATQRPSADVITGLMKANIPSRIAFAVSSGMESRIILDQVGAEKLIGMGDMLFSPVGCGKPRRIQGAFVSDEERERVIDYIKENCGASTDNSEIEDYMNKALESKKHPDSGKGKGDMDSDNGFDELLPQAVEIVFEVKSCSTSFIQRKIKVGYARAARIVDQMEELGIVGPSEGAKSRPILADYDKWLEVKEHLGFTEE